MVIWVILDYHPLQILQIIITSIIFNIISILLIITITITFMMMMIMIMLNHHHNYHDLNHDLAC